MHILCLHYSIHTKLSVSCIYILCFYLPNLAVLITIFQSQSPSLLPFSKSRGERATLIEIFALKATLCNFKILPDPGRESWGENGERGTAFGCCAKVLPNNFGSKTKAQAQQWQKGRWAKENKKMEGNGKWKFVFLSQPTQKKK